MSKTPARSTHVLSTMTAILVLGLAAGSLAIAGDARASARVYRVVPVPDGGSVQGVLTLAGTRPERAFMPVSTDEAICGEHSPDLSVAVGAEGQVQWGFVYLEGVTQGKALSAAPVRVANQGCVYRPFVQGAPVGGKLEVVNEDQALHNVHFHMGPRTLWNIALPLQGITVTKDLPERAGALELTCDVHEWMRATVHVMEHPYYATTDEHGAFTLEGVPPGDYVLVATHPRWGSVRQPVTVAAGQTVTASLQMQQGS